MHEKNKMTRRKNLIDAEKAQLKELWEQGLSGRETSKKIGLNYRTVRSWFSAYNAGFNSITDYLNFKSIQTGYPNSWLKYHQKSLQQRFEDSIPHCSYRYLFSKLEKQESENSRIAHSYEIDAVGLVHKLLDELGKTRKGKRDVTILREYYFNSKTDEQIGEIIGKGELVKQAYNQLRQKALNKLREICDRTEISRMFC